MVRETMDDPHYDGCVGLGIDRGVYVYRKRADRQLRAQVQEADDAVGEDFHVTPREREVLDLISMGDSTKEIARKLGISPKTVEFHRANLLRKYGARTSSQLVALST